MPLGMLIFGPMSDFIKIELILIVTGLLLIIMSFILMGNKVLIEAGNQTIKPNHNVDNKVEQ